MEENKQFEKLNNFENYSIFIHGYLVPWFGQLRETGSIVQGKLRC